jgi:hypothetical protein
MLLRMEGTVNDNMRLISFRTVAKVTHPKLTHIIADKWDDSFDNVLEDKPQLLILKSSWVQKCHEAQKLVAFQKFMVSQ